MLGRNSITDLIVEPSRSSRRKEEARQIEFVRIGQSLKLETIVKVLAYRVYYIGISIR